MLIFKDNKQDKDQLIDRIFESEKDNYKNDKNDK